jgi:hypothetical protein
LVQRFNEKPESDDTLCEIAYRCEEMLRPVLKKQGHHGTVKVPTKQKRP